jgi:hypothetical protein
MTALSSPLVPAVLEAYSFSGIHTLTDFAGGHGLVLCEILNHNPRLRGILFDFEKVIQDSNASSAAKAAAAPWREISSSTSPAEPTLPGARWH